MADVFTCFREAAIPFIDVAFTKQLYMKLNEVAEGEEEKNVLNYALMVHTKIIISLQLIIYHQRRHSESTECSRKLECIIRLRDRPSLRNSIYLSHKNYKGT